MIFAQVGAGVLSIGLQHVSILLINVTHSARPIRVKPVGVVVKAHIVIGHYFKAGRHCSLGTHSHRPLTLSRSAW